LLDEGQSAQPSDATSALGINKVGRKRLQHVQSYVDVDCVVLIERGKHVVYIRLTNESYSAATIAIAVNNAAN
jgi:hypothetical protein